MDVRYVLKDGDERERARPREAAARRLGPLADLGARAGNAAVANLLAIQRSCVPGHAGPASSFGFKSGAQLTPAQWARSGQATYLSLLWNTDDVEMVPLGSGTSTSSVTHGAEHAEDVALRTITEHVTMFDPGVVNELHLEISKSPCTSTSRGGKPATSTKAKGCTEELIDLAKNGITSGGHTYRFKLVLVCRGRYSPSVAGHTQADVLAASGLAIEALRAAGVTVSGDVRSGAVTRFGVT